MNENEASKVLDSMVQFIRNHGQEKAATIRRQAEQEFTIGKSRRSAHRVEKEKFIKDEKNRIEADYENKLQQDEIKMRM